MNVFWYHYFNEYCGSTGSTQGGKRLRGQLPQEANAVNPGLRLWSFSVHSLCPRHCGLLPILHPTELIPTFSLCTCSSYNPECSFSQLFAGLASHHLVFSSKVVFSERFPLTIVARLPSPLPVHLSIFVFLIEVITI